MKTNSNYLLHLPPIQTQRSIFGTRFTRPGFTAAHAEDDPSLMQMDAPAMLPAGSMIRTGSPFSKEAIIHGTFTRRP